MTERQKFIRQLYDNERNFLMRLACLVSKNEADAEDLVHEVFACALSKCDELMAHPDPEAWLAVTLKYYAKNNRRRMENTRTVPLNEYGERPLAEEAEPLSHILPSTLSQRDRELLIWRLEEKRSYREISERTGISEAACRVRVCRIMKRCKKLMKEK